MFSFSLNVLNDTTRIAIISLTFGNITILWSIVNCIRLPIIMMSGTAMGFKLATNLYLFQTRFTLRLLKTDLQMHKQEDSIMQLYALQLFRLSLANSAVYLSIP